MAKRRPAWRRPARQERVEAGVFLAQSFLELAELPPVPGMQPHRQNFP